MRIVDASAADLAHVLSVERQAFGGDDVPNLVAELLADPSAQPLISLLAWNGERPVGHILFTRVRVAGASREVSGSILAPLGVVPGAQRTGVGGRLIEHGIERLAAAGVELVFVLGHPSYYPRHGFAPASRLGLAAPYPISPDEAWMVRELRPGVLGTARGTVVCADAMSRPEHWT